MAESSGRPLERVLRSKRNEEWKSPITGLKLLLFGIQLTLIGGFVDGVGVLVLVGGLFGFLGLLVR